MEAKYVISLDSCQNVNFQDDIQSEQKHKFQKTKTNYTNILSAVEPKTILEDLVSERH